MNFFGHATAAAWYDAQPAFVLGAMLPDFQGMLAIGPPAFLEASVERGVRLHHATDAAFHAIPEVIALMATSRRHLLDAGVGRGPARAAAHVGTEILLDEAFAADPRAVSSYLAALELAITTETAVAWSLPAAHDAFRRLVHALARGGVSPTVAPAALVATRLRRALARRPRLALSDREETLVRDWVVAARAGIVGCAPLIVSELQSRLTAAGFGSKTHESIDPARLG